MSSRPPKYQMIGIGPIWDWEDAKYFMQTSHKVTKVENTCEKSHKVTKVENVQTIMQIINKAREYFVQTIMQIIKKGREYFSPETDHPAQCARAYRPVLLLVHVLE